MDFTQYWFMLPVATGVATCAMLSGIGGAALFTPIFVIVLPLLGPDYTLPTALAAIASALLTETFGFSSGFVGYYRKKLIDFDLGWRLLKWAAPFGFLGGVIAFLFPEWFLILGYGLLMLVIAVVFLRHQSVRNTPNASDLSAVIVTRTDAQGIAYQYARPDFGWFSHGLTAIGALLTGLVSVGIGEVVMPQLIKRGIPMPVAAATSVLVVIVTAGVAATALIVKLLQAGGLTAMPWNLVCYTIPGVIIGGQIGPRLQGKLSHRAMEQMIALLFTLIGMAMIYIAIVG